MMATSQFGNGASWAGEIFEDSVRVGPEPQRGGQVRGPLDPELDFFNQFNSCGSSCRCSGGHCGVRSGGGRV